MNRSCNNTYGEWHRPVAALDDHIWQSCGRIACTLILSAMGCISVTGCGDDALTSPDNVESSEELRLRWSEFRLPGLGEMGLIPQDPNNPLTPAKVELGRLLFHDPTLLSVPEAETGRASASCATCHHASAGFQAGVQQGIGEGGSGFGPERTSRADYLEVELDVQPVRTPSAMNAAWFDNVLWNGQFGATGVNIGTSASWTEDTPREANHLGFHGLETQAIAGQEVHRLSVEAAGLRSVPRYVELFDEAFPEQAPAERINQVNAGLAIAAFERTVMANEAPFQAWLRGDDAAMSEHQLEGARLFFGPAGCADCHNNPGLGGMSFHALGMADLPSSFPRVEEDAVEHRGRGGFTGDPREEYAFKTPQLYNLLDTPFLGHGGTFRSVRDVIQYKNQGIAENGAVPAMLLSPLFVPLGLSQDEVDALTDFVEHALYDPNLARYQPSQGELPSGACVPNEDVVSREALVCTGDLPAPPFALGGTRLVNTEITEQTWTFPEDLVLSSGGLLIIARSASRDEFEAHWGRLPPGVLYLSAGAQSSGAPIINGGETFSLENPAGEVIDGPCPTMTEGYSMKRTSSDGWQEEPADAGSPGRVEAGFEGHGLIITEVSDAAGTGAYRFEFVEVGYFP
jgi:cytochrome c peroxidase